MPDSHKVQTLTRTTPTILFFFSSLNLLVFVPSNEASLTVSSQSRTNRSQHTSHHPTASIDQRKLRLPFVVIYTRFVQVTLVNAALASKRTRQGSVLDQRTLHQPFIVTQRRFVPSPLVKAHSQSTLHFPRSKLVKARSSIQASPTRDEHGVNHHRPVYGQPGLGASWS